MSLRRAALVVCALLLARVASAQEGTLCNFQGAQDRPVQVIKQPSGQSNTFTGGGVTVRCPARGITLRADSLEYFGDERRIFLVGHVNYDEPRLKLTSDQLTYFVPDERVVAVGNVNATLPSGSRLVGPQAEFRRAAPGIRTESQLTAVGRPSVTLVEGQSARRDTTTPPTVVTANSLFVRGDSLIYGSGKVDIRRPDLIANGDSVFLDKNREFMRLLGTPHIEGRRDRPYRLAGQLIDLYSKDRHLQRVVARGGGSAVSEDMTLTADTIELALASDLLQRAVAWGPAGARAVSPAQTITADSITAVMPDQRVRLVTASRRALAEARPDTVRIRTAEKDWLRGDTIVARFDTVAARDSSRQPQIRQLVATGDARSYYHMPPADTAARDPAINYVTGKLITVAFDSQRVARVTVGGQRSGLYLEPRDTVAVRRATRGSSSPAPAPARPQPPPARRRPGLRVTPEPQRGRRDGA